MSRLTATQVINVGEYLEPTFDPSTLTISQLLGILGYHNIQYPTPYSKAKLVQVFNDEVKTRSTKLKKDRLKRQNSSPSDDGIVDGHTGKLIAPTKQPTARRSTRRSSQAPVVVVDDDDDEPTPPPPDPPKRRRSSAKPDLAGPSTRKSLVQPTLAERSEPEDEPEVNPPPRKIVKGKKSADTASRRTSMFGEDSGWEDNNIFQSGAEDSSPARPSPARSRIPRKSGTVKRSRQSMSAPPDSSPTQSPIAPPQTKFSPKFDPPPPLVFPRSIPKPKPAGPFNFVAKVVEEEAQAAETLHAVKKYRSPEPGEPDIEDEDIEQEEQLDVPEEQEEVEQLALEEEQALEELEEELSLDQASENELVVSTHASTSPNLIVRALTLILAGLVVAYGWKYKSDSAAIGFCDTGSQTNNALEDLRSYRAAVEACNRENRTDLYLPPLENSSTTDPGKVIPCPLPSLIPLPHANACTPCPRHATCSQFSVQCDTGYLLKPHPLLLFFPDPPQSLNLTLSSASTPSETVWAILSAGLDGLPGFGPIALPPRCALDPRRQKNIGALGKAMESLLAQERGRRLCSGGKELSNTYPEGEGGEARKWGMDLQTLGESVKRKASNRLKPAFDDTFNEAVQELVQSGGVVLGADQEGRRYLASKEANLTWDCVVTVKARDIWAAWRGTAFGGLVAIVVSILARLRIAQKKAEARRVGELVQIALDTLRNQELAHHTDPVTTPHPYLSSIQLRDVILQNEHSIPTRRRLWDQVEHIVEGNANVRANLEEIEGGDELRVWRWVGSTGRGL
ncbi:Man1-Src1p-C-terminal domain-containing protein [Coprinopsis sp. MPI-PUGE-AT-0042]|nr:Man1-Src1p-C-terminal domain-containing protein [Coprinopsis sp. MPI-PUGE-AT-0042]